MLSQNRTGTIVDLPGSAWLARIQFRKMEIEVYYSCSGASDYWLLHLRTLEKGLENERKQINQISISPGSCFLSHYARIAIALAADAGRREAHQRATGKNDARGKAGPTATTRRRG